MSCYTLEFWDMIYNMGVHVQFTGLLNACILKSIRLYWPGRYAAGKTFDSKRTGVVWSGTRSDIGTYRWRFCHVHSWWSKFANIHVYFTRSENRWQWINIRTIWLNAGSNHKHLIKSNFRAPHRYEPANLLRLKQQRLLQLFGTMVDRGWSLVARGRWCLILYWRVVWRILSKSNQDLWRIDRLCHPQDENCDDFCLECIYSSIS